MFCFSAQSTDTDINNLILTRTLTDVPDIDPRNAGQGLLPLMVAFLASKRHSEMVCNMSATATCIANDGNMLLRIGITINPT